MSSWQAVNYLQTILILRFVSVSVRTGASLYCKTRLALALALALTGFSGVSVERLWCVLGFLHCNWFEHSMSYSLV